MTGRSEPFCGSGRVGGHLKFAWLLSFAGLLWFLLIYGGMDALTAHRSLRVKVNLEAEKAIPFIPEAAVIYMSIYPPFLAARHSSCVSAATSSPSP